MAIIQISRIQVRRGKEQQGTGVPRLASGELGWAVDSQRLYIGSGSTQEGAPIEGNVRLLTANDNILDLSEQYFYKAEFDSEGIRTQEAPGAVGRDIQSRLDDFVSANNFGVIKDGLSDDTLALQSAIDAVSEINSNKISRAVLYLPAGTYRITQTLLVPSYVQIIGAGVENTVIFNNSGSVFETVGDVPINQIDIDTQPRHVKISDLSIECETNSSAVFLRSCRDSEFKNIRLLGSWFIPQPGEPTPTNNSNYAFELESLSTVVTCKNNVFENVYVEKFAKAVYAPTTVINNSFKNFKLYELEKGFELGEENQLSNGPTLTVIENCDFELIEKQGIEVLSGEYNTSRSNRFRNVGNDGGLEPVTPVIDFKTNTNISVNDYFDRTELIAVNAVNSPLLDKEYVPEVSGRTKFENMFPVETVIGRRDNFEPFIKLPFIDNGTIVIDYVYTIKDFNIVREGTLSLTINRSLGDPENDSEIVVVDDYTTTGDTVNSNLLEFDAGFASFNPNSIIDTILIEAKNSILGLTDDVFYYTIKSKT